MTAKSNKILENVHPLAIIREVQKWPVLYSRDSRERGNMHFKTKVWHEVGKSLFNDWESCPDDEKESRVIDLTKRWRNLRDTFKRQVELERRIREGYKTKKKTYVYFKHMLFLLPHVTSDAQESPNLDAFFSKSGKKSSKRKIEQHFVDEAPLSVPRVSRNSCDVDEIDEDRHFALSLIPTLKKMSDDEKLLAKMEILKVLQNVRKKSRKKREEILYVEESNSNPGVKLELLQSEGAEEGNDLESGKSDDSD